MDNVEECDVCGSTQGVECEIMMKGDRIDRVYHLCPEHWVAVYRECIEDFMEHNPYKVNSFLKVAADRLIINEMHSDKLETMETHGELDLNDLNPVQVRILRTFDAEGGSDE